VDSAVVGNDQILTVYSPDATADEQSYSWSSACEYELWGSEFLSPGVDFEVHRRGVGGTYTPGSLFNRKFFGTFFFSPVIGPYFPSKPFVTFDNSGYTIVVYTGNAPDFYFLAIDEDGNNKYHFRADLSGFTNPDPIAMTFDTDAEVLIVAIQTNDPAFLVLIQFTPQYRQTGNSASAFDVLYELGKTDRTSIITICPGPFTGGIAAVPIAGELLTPGGLPNRGLQPGGHQFGESILVFFGYCPANQQNAYFAISRKYDDVLLSTNILYLWVLNPPVNPSAVGPVNSLAWDAVNQHIIVAGNTKETIYIKVGVPDVITNPADPQLLFPARLTFTTESLPSHPFGEPVAFRKSAACSPSNNPNYGGVALGGLSAVASIPNYVLLREFLGITPTPRTGGLKTWLTNRWSSPNGLPCEESQASKLVAADDVVFLCSGVQLGDNQRWGSSSINGWTRFWEWQDISWGLRWRWQGDVHFGTDHSESGVLFDKVAPAYKLAPGP